MAYKMRISDWSSDVCSSDLQAAIAVRQLEAGGVLEGLQGTAFDLAGIQQHVELAQRGVAIDGFEVVVGAEQPLPASLTLALSDGAERAEERGRASSRENVGKYVYIHLVAGLLKKKTK